MPETTINRPQYADNWAFLNHKCLPTNVDGLAHHIVERRGRFLFLEVKRGESTSDGQQFMLEALARIPQFDVVIVHSLRADPDDKNCRAVLPIAIQKYDRTGKLGEMQPCDADQFRLKYAQWFRSQRVSEDKEVS